MHLSKRSKGKYYIILYAFHFSYSVAFVIATKSNFA